MITNPNINAIQNVSPYTQKLKTLVGAGSTVGIWPLNEMQGTVAYDYSDSQYHATSSGIVRSDPYRSFRAPDGGRCYRFDGSASYVDLVSALPSSAVSEGSMGIFVAIDELVLAGTSKAQIFKFAADADNFLDLSVDTTAQRIAAEHEGNTTNNTITKLVYNDPYQRYWPLWHHYGFRYSETLDTFDLFFDGVKQTTQTGLGTFTGSFNSATMILGASNTTVADLVSGFMSNFCWFSSILTDDEMIELSKVP